MIIENFNGNMVNFYHENPSMMELYEWRNSKIYKEIILFLNDFNADWRKKKELGEYASEFILRIIEEYENEETEQFFVEWLTLIYREIADRYVITKSNYQFARVMREDTRELIEEYTTDDDFMEEEFEKAYKKLKKEEDDTICLFF